MSDQQKARALSISLGNEMTRSAKRRAIDPPGLESECVELLPENITDLADAGKIHRAAVDVDETLQKRESFGVSSVHRSDYRALGFIELCASGLCAGSERKAGRTQGDKAS
jgi:hypothetical protein